MERKVGKCQRGHGAKAMHRGCSSSSSEWRKNRCIVYDCGRAMPKSAQLCRIGGTSAKLRDCCTGSRHGRRFPAGWDVGSSVRRFGCASSRLLDEWKVRNAGPNMRVGSPPNFLRDIWDMIRISYSRGWRCSWNEFFFLFDCKLQFSIFWNISMIIREIALFIVFLIFFFVLREWWFYLSAI